MSQQLNLRNFKCFEALNLDLKPVTLLAGLNAAGKSSVIQALLLLRQLRVTDNTGAIELRLNGALVQLGTAKDVFYEYAESDELEIGLTREDQRFSWRFMVDEIANALTLLAGEGNPLALQNQPVQYICAERWGPRTSYPLSEDAIRAGRLGIHGEYAFHYLIEHGDDRIVNERAAHDDQPSRKLRKQVEAWLREISPGVHIDAKAIDDADIAVASFRFSKEGDVASRGYRPTNVGFGLSYAISIIIALLTAPPGGLVLIENPEAHLHPRGQSRLAQLIAQASHGATVVVETHSDHLMNGFRLAVLNGLVAPCDMGLNFFERQQGRCIAQALEIDADGRLPHWPEGFFDEGDKILAALVARKRKNK